MPRLNSRARSGVMGGLSPGYGWTIACEATRHKMQTGAKPKPSTENIQAGMGCIPVNGVLWASTPAVRRVMQANRSKDTVPELAVRQAVHAMGFRYQVSTRPCPQSAARPTWFSGKQRSQFSSTVASGTGAPTTICSRRSTRFIGERRLPTTRARDKKTTVELRTGGWTVLRFWTHVQPKAAAVQIAYVVRSKRLGRDSISLEKFKSKKRSGGASESS